MSREQPPQSGWIDWMDLTVPDAERVHDFYREVVGWTTSEVAMGEYDDYCVQEPGSNRTVAGICHARGVNADLPPMWLPYITVEDLDRSIARCEELGRVGISGPRGAGGTARYCVIRDPSGAAAALYSSGT